MIAYIDSSVLLRVVLGQPERLLEWRDIREGSINALVEVECLRTLDRLRLRALLTEHQVAAARGAIFALIQQMHVIELTSLVLWRAAQPLPTSLGTLDAIHLASAMLWRERDRPALVLATHDEALGLAARAMGMPTVGVVTVG